LSYNNLKFANLLNSQALETDPKGNESWKQGKEDNNLSEIINIE
jgi:hypothetical protein